MIKTLLKLFLVLALAQQGMGPGPGTPHLGALSLSQYKYFSSAGTGTGGSSCGVATSACTVTATSVAAKHLLVVVAANASSLSETMNAPTTTGATETFTHCPGCAVAYATVSENADAYYTLSSVGGDTAITCHWSGVVTFGQACLFFDFAYTGSSISLDTGATPYGIVANASCSTSACPGVALTLAGQRDAIVQVMLPSAGMTFSAVSSPYNSIFNNYDGSGQAAAINISSGSAPQFTPSTTGASTGLAIAFKGN